MIDRQALRANISEYLKTEYIALLGQSGSGVQMFIESLIYERPFIPYMKFISLSLPDGVENEKDFKELLLDRLIRGITNIPPEKVLQGKVEQEVRNWKHRTLDFQLRKALDILGRETTADPLVIVLQSLATASEKPLKDLLRMLRDYHQQRNLREEPGKKLRFLAVGDLRLWLLCCSRMSNDASPFNIAKRVFLDGLSSEELQMYDQFGNLEAAMQVRSLTAGIPSLIEKIIELREISNDLSLFFEQIDDHWNALPEVSRRALMRLAEGSEDFPDCIPDYQCRQIPWIESPWLEAFWKGFLGVQDHTLTWRSLIHRAFVLNKMPVRRDTSKSNLIRVDLRERATLLQKALRHTKNSENQRQHLEKALEMALQTPDSILAPVLKMVHLDEKKSTVLEKLSQVVATTDKGWMKDLEERARASQESLTNLVIDAVAWETRRSQGDFDVFLCHNAEDKPMVKKIAEKLLELGLLPWLDLWELRPGLPWQPILEQQIGRIKAATIFIGYKGLGPWQNEELNALLSESHRRGCVVIPVVLPIAPQELETRQEIDIPLFLRNRTWVNFQRADPDPMQQLIWGITGKRRSIQ